MKLQIFFLLLIALIFSQDWPQLQQNSERTGYTEKGVDSPVRARWIWFGLSGPKSAEWVLRNQKAGTGAKWKDDLTSSDNKSYNMPDTVPFSFGSSMQPIVYQGKVFVADLQGSIYAISLDDGSTLWTATNPGGTFLSGAAAANTVVFTSLYGYITAFDINTGKVLWQIDSGRSITTAPAVKDGVIYAASQNGNIYAIEIKTGSIIWQSDSGAMIQGGLCLKDGFLYTGNEKMEALCLDIKNGKIISRQGLTGQSFRMTWPVAVQDRIIFTTVPTICVGAEFINDAVLAGRPNDKIGYQPDLKPGYPDRFKEEEAVRKWLQTDSGKYWETTFSLKIKYLKKDYIIATGVSDGCGRPPNPPALINGEMPVVWWATAYGSLLRDCGFGFNFTMDICMFDPKTGNRVLINENKLLGKQTTEADNLYAFSTAGDWLYLRNSFRGNTMINLKTRRVVSISALYRNRDGGTWTRPINYAAGNRNGHPASWDENIKRIPTSKPATSGRSAITIADSKLIWTEDFCITCAETDK